MSEAAEAPPPAHQVPAPAAERVPESLPEPPVEPSHPRELEPVAAAEPSPVLTLDLGKVIWLAAGLLFAGLRLGPIWQAPVGGAELAHLAGAWQASIGVEDSRYVPTLFQFLTSALLRISDSEVPARTLAYAATLTLPFALYRLRRTLGEPVALLALLLLAFDASTIGTGSSASAMGFDLALAGWLFVAVAERKAIPSGLAAILAFLCATAGPIVLPLLFAIAIVAIFDRRRPSNALLAELAGGAVFGVIISSIAYGTGPVTLRLAPVDLLSDSFEQRWSTMTTAEVLLVYAAPLLLGALASLAALGLSHRRGGRLDAWESLLIAWFAVTAGWAIASSNAHSPAAAAALTLPAALLAARGLTRAIPAMLAADWRIGRILIPVAVVVALIALFFSIDWARLNALGDTEQQLLVTALLIGSLTALLAVAIDRKSRASLLSVALAVGALPTISGAFGVGLSGTDEPLPSPRSTVQARQLRDIALGFVNANGGAISIHPSLEQQVTWPFRDSGNIEIASTPSANATVLIWPAGLAGPEGYSLLDGTWALEESVAPPTDDGLRYLKWATDRNTLAITPDGIAVYLKAGGEGE